MRQFIFIAFLFSQLFFVQSCVKDDNSSNDDTSCGLQLTRINDLPFDLDTGSILDFFVFNETAYLFYKPNATIVELHKYNEVSDSWEYVSVLPNTGSIESKIYTFIIGDFVYLAFSEVNSNNIPLKLFQYDPINISWEEKTGTTFPDKGWSGQISINSFSLDNLGYLFSTSNEENFRMYNPITNSWELKTGFLTYEFINHVGFTFSNSIYILGGGCYNFDCYSSSIYKYNSSLDEWTSSSMPTNYGFSGKENGFVFNNNVYVFGQLENDASQLTLFNKVENSTDWSKKVSCENFFITALFNLGSKGYIQVDYPYEMRGQIYKISL